MIPEWQAAGLPHLWMPYSQMKTAPLPLPVVRGAGAQLQLASGQWLWDGLASWWTACHGYAHPHQVSCVQRQLERLPHVMLGGLQHEPAAVLATRLAKCLPGDLDHVFFVDSGSVAVEVALKMAVQYWRNQGNTRRNKLVTFLHAYHGDTTGAMSLCDPVEGMHAHFKGILLEQFPRPFPRNAAERAEFAAFLQLHHAEVAGVIVEPRVQAAGGFKFHSPDDLAAVARLTQDAGLLLIADEIATGFGRTGSLFACQTADVVPDILCLGKALTGGMLSLACTVATQNVFNRFWSDDPQHALMHGPTYMGNPLACAAALASLDLFETEPRLQQVAQIERQLQNELKACRKLAGVVDVRVLGALGVVELERPIARNWFRDFAVARDCWLRPLGNVLYLTPPFVISPEGLSQLTQTVYAALLAAP